MSSATRCTRGAPPLSAPRPGELHQLGDGVYLVLRIRPGARQYPSIERLWSVEALSSSGIVSLTWGEYSTAYWRRLQ